MLKGSGELSGGPSARSPDPGASGVRETAENPMVNGSRDDGVPSGGPGVD